MTNIRSCSRVKIEPIPGTFKTYTPYLQQIELVSGLLDKRGKIFGEDASYNVISLFSFVTQKFA